MNKKNIISMATAFAASVSVHTNTFALTTSRIEPMSLTDEEYTYPSFSNGNVLLNKKNGRLPAMGWNSWNAFGSGNTEALTKAMADKITELGLDKLGYEYMVLDDGCYKSTRVDGKLANNEKFPSGFKALSDYMHERGLKFGMYNDIGTNLCAGAAVGTCGYEDVDAKTYIDWGVDFLKVDNCYYLWDNATFSNSENAKYTYAPNIRSVTVKGSNLDITLNAVTDGELTGRGASKNTSGDYVTNIGTYDGTNVGNTPVGEQSGELMFTVAAPADGEYKVTVNYMSGTTVGCGQWLQVAVGDAENETRYFDDLLSASSSFTDSSEITVNLKAGENILRLMNHRRQENTLYSYAALLDGLNKADPDHDVLLSICEWGKTQPQNWGYKVGSSWRILNDISFAVGSNGNPGSAAWSSNNTASITSQYSKAVIMDEFAGLDRGWNDPDMFVIGMNGITTTMSKTHMTMWCMMNSPLMLGMDLRRVEKGDELYNIIANKDMIGLDQDALGIQAKRIYCSLSDSPDTDYVTNTNRTDILAKPLANGDVALSFINVSSAADTVKRSVDVDTIVKYIGSKMTNADSFKNAQSYYIRDLWTNDSYMTLDKEFSVDSLDACDNVTIRISPIQDISSIRGILGDKIEYSKAVLAQKEDGGKKLLADANSEYSNAIASAEAVYNNSSDMEELKNSYSDLTAAEEKLNGVYERYDVFGEFISACDNIKNIADRYEHDDAWNEFCAELEKAHGIYNDPQSEEEINTVTAALNTAKAKLRRVLGDGLNPIAWYIFDAADGTADHTGNGNTAKLVNSGAKVTENRTLSLNRDNENNGYMELPSGLLSDADDFAVTAWVKIDEARTWARIFDFGTSAADGYMFLCPYNDSGMTAYAITASDNNNEQSLTATPPAVGEWVHMAVIQEGNTAKIYIDGKAVSAGSFTNTPKNSIGSSAKHYIGKSQFDADPYFKGEIMDLRIYDKSLTEDEVNTVMADFDPDPEVIPSISIHPDYYAVYNYEDDNDAKKRSLNMEITNISKETKNVNAAFAAYNENGKLTDIKIKNAEIEAGKKKVLSEEAYDDINTTIFVWDNMQPIIKAIVAPPYTEPETVWSVVRKNEDNVSYTAGNSLTIKTQRGDIWGTADGSGTVENLYLTDIKGDFDAEVTVKYKPSANYQRGALVAYLGDGNHVSVMRRYHSAYQGNVFMTTMNINGAAGSEDKYTADTAGESCKLRLVREGAVFRGYFSTDNGATWNELETREHSVLGAAETVKIGFYASNGDIDASSEDVIFENFTINGKVVTFNNVE